VSEDADIAMLNLEAEGFEQMGRFQYVAARKNDVWALPVIAFGRLFLRYYETLLCYVVMAR
jgi:hypothetical protein